MTAKEIKKEIEKLENEYSEECKAIAEGCEEEGYPAHGENYDLRCESAYNSYYKAKIDDLYDALYELKHAGKNTREVAE